ncbi:hypothetical protein BaRGS_00024952 [Batillaria attramentaria]|uniref:LicD/FKTN/FKRP nucleotidyltransferase domain-containing protein n=1 Tax=Batillaria attramentaria TaxID=370345 RepID=A0ABD0K9V5_9CAEN
MICVTSLRKRLRRSSRGMGKVLPTSVCLLVLSLVCICLHSVTHSARRLVPQYLHTLSPSTEVPDIPNELPVFWREHSRQDVVKRLRQPTQNFSINDPFDHTGSNLTLAPLRVNITREMSKFRKPAFPEYHQEMQRLRTAWKDDDEAVEDFILYETFPPLSSESRAQLIFTMDVFVRACRQYGWTYFMEGGALLGAYRHHGLIPWDVDIDVVVNGSNWREVRHVLGNTPGFTLWTQRSGVWRFYLSDLPEVGGSSKWPFVEIGFFAEDVTHLWGFTNSLRPLMFDKKHVFPLATAKWEHLYVNVPACTERLVKKEFNVSTCVSHYMVSDLGPGFQVRDPEGRVECTKLHPVYPFVFRYADITTGNIVESRRVGNRILEEFSKPQEPAVCKH